MSPCSWDYPVESDDDSSFSVASGDDRGGAGTIITHLYSQKIPSSLIREGQGSIDSASNNTKNPTEYKRY